ncbi:MAG TPA: class I SAM-dependent methyltransferase [Phnomibacter sp.]|nr:class I SAM-dependent methyltransferase [Phnomibacter sp.]
MTRIDILLRNWRIAMAVGELSGIRHLLDIGCLDGYLLLKLQPQLERGTGIDPLAEPGTPAANIALVKGYFPDALGPQPQPFEAITALALIEHLPDNEAVLQFFTQCHRCLVPGGRVVATIPHPWVDAILWLLKKLRLVKGMSTEEHHGYPVNQTTVIAQQAGFKLVKRRRFQLGLNNLFVFTRL